MTDALIERLRGEVAGPVLAPGDERYAEELSGFNLAVTHTPDVVVGLTSEDEGKLFRFTLVHSVFLACVVGIVAMLFAYVFPSLVPTIHGLAPTR